MRLAQLARKLSLNQAEIVGFLASNNIQIEESANAKLDDDQTQLIVQHFAPNLQLSITEELSPLEAEKFIDEEINIPVTEPEAEELIMQPLSVEEELQPEATEDKSEIIRAPKVELTGLKVLGRIELPEKKKKDEVEENTDTVLNEEKTKEQEVEKKIIPHREAVRHDRKKSLPRPAKNPLAIAREHELAKEQEKRKAETERRKQIKAQNYAKKIQQTTPQKRAKIDKKPIKIKRVVQQKPKSLWARFIKWLTT